MKAIYALALAAILFTACEKEEDPAPAVPYEKSWSLWTIPADTAALLVMVNGDTIPVTHSYYNQPAMIPAALRTQATYYVGDYRVRPNDHVRIEATGRHHIHLTTVDIATVEGQVYEFDVYPGSE